MRIKYGLLLPATHTRVANVVHACVQGALQVRKQQRACIRTSAAEAAFRYNV